MTSALVSRRRHPAVLFVFLVMALVAVGGLYSVMAPGRAAQAESRSYTQNDVSEGHKLFLANCSTCHGQQGQGSSAGPSLVGVGAAAVDFQVGTGRMPLSGPSVQAQRSADVKFTDEQIRQMAAYVDSLGPGPAVPDEAYASGIKGDVARGGEIYRVNCAMCHNFAGSGGALTRGKFAPPLRDIQGKHIYEAMLTGPQSMPVFDDANLNPQAKADIISYLHTMDEGKNAGGHSLGNLGPVAEGFFLWLIGIPVMLGAAVWLGRKAA